MLLAPAAVLLLAGCILTSGQFTIDFDLANPIVVAGPLSVIPMPIDLSGEEVYQDYKNDIKDFADVALVGLIHNLGTDVIIDVWMTRDQTLYTTAAEVRANGVQVWGPFPIAAGAEARIEWDTSAALFSGRVPLLDEIRGDGAFTLYAVGSEGQLYNFELHDGVLVITVDAGI
jgi:hypothetical protein